MNKLDVLAIMFVVLASTSKYGRPYAWMLFGMTFFAWVAWTLLDKGAA